MNDPKHDTNLRPNHRPMRRRRLLAAAAAAALPGALSRRPATTRTMRSG